MPFTFRILYCALLIFSSQYNQADGLSKYSEEAYVNILDRPADRPTNQTHSLHSNNLTQFDHELLDLTKLSAAELDFAFIKKLFLIFVYIILWIICVFGNILVILSVHTHKPLQSVQNKFIVSLALADTFVALFVIPFQIILHITNGVWLFNSVTCHFFLTADIFLCTSSILHLLCIALDRYWSIKDSIKYGMTRTKSVLVMIVLAWLTSAIISLPVIYWNTKTVGNRLVNESSPPELFEAIQQNSSQAHGNPDRAERTVLVCDIPQDKLYRFYSSSGTFWLPLLVMTFVYIQIFLETKRRLQERSKQVQKLAKVIENSTNRPSRTAADRESNCLRCFTGNRSEVRLKTKILVFADRQTALEKESFLKSQTVSDQKEANGLTADPVQTKKRQPTQEWERRSIMDTSNALKKRQKQSLNRERRAARTLVFIMGSFIFCWLPFFVVYSLQPFNFFEVTQSLFSYLTCLGYVNSALNPVIYTVFNIDFRKGFKRLLFECVLFKPRY